MKKLLLFVFTAFVLLGLSSCDRGIVEGAGEELKVLSLEDIKGEKVVVDLWHSFGHAVGDELTALCDAFEVYAKDTLGLEIEVNADSTGGGYNGLRNRVNLGINSNSLPTMLLGYPDHFAGYIAQDILLPLDEFVYSSDSDVAFDGVTKNGNENDIIQSYWEENQLNMSYNGGPVKKQVAGIPFNKSTEIMVYNSNVVDPILMELGIIQSTEELWENPTWEQVFNVSRIVQERQKAAPNGIEWTYMGGKNSLVKKDFEYPVYVDSEANFFITASRQWGGVGNYTYLDENNVGVVDISADKNKEAMNYFLDMASNAKKYFNFPSKKQKSYGSDLMVTKNAVISIGSTAGIRQNSKGPYKLKSTGIPQRSYDSNATQAVIQQGTNLAILSKNSNNKTRLAAWLLIKFLTNQENTEKFSRATGYLPVRYSTLNSASYQAFMNNVDDQHEGVIASAVKAAFSQEDYFFTDIAFAGSATARGQLEPFVQTMFADGKSFDIAAQLYLDELKRLGINVKK